MRPNDPNVRREATKLVQYLRDMAAPARADVVDLGEFERCWWLAGLPDGVRSRARPGRDGDLLTVDQVRLPAPPPCPWPLHEHVDERQWTDHLVAEVTLSPDLLAVVVDPAAGTPLKRTYLEAAAARREWLGRVDVLLPRRDFYDEFRRLARRLSTQDDEYELVLCSGLVSGVDDRGRRIRRHLLVKRLFVRIDAARSAVTIGPDDDSPPRLEDRRFLMGVLGERLGLADAIRGDVENSELVPTEDGVHKWLSEWTSLLLPEAPPFDPAVVPPDAGETGPLRVSASPALILRRRDRSGVARFYDRILDQLRDPDTAVPQGMAQIVRTLTPDERRGWLEAATGRRTDVLSEDPLFPREHNAEQRRVLGVVRADNGAVVQGPPGTGKTHTIANLTVALLADGLRVLVVSQREQPLRVLRGMLPPGIRDLCVSLVGAEHDGTSELEASVRAMAARVVDTDPGEATAAMERRIGAQRAVAEIEIELALVRQTEHTDHPPVAPGYQGRLAQIAQQVSARRDRFGWFPALPPSAAVRCPLSVTELRQLLSLVNEHPSGPVRADEFVPRAERIDSPADIETILSAMVEPAAGPEVDKLARALAAVPPPELDGWRETTAQVLKFAHYFNQIAATAATGHPTRAWLGRVVEDLLAGRNAGAWRDLRGTAHTADGLSARSRNPVLQDVRVIDRDLVSVKSLRDQAATLVQGLRDGRSVRRRFLGTDTGFGRATQLVRERCRYRHDEPRTQAAAEAVHELLDVLAGVVELDHIWGFVAPTRKVSSAPGQLLNWLIEAERHLPRLLKLDNCVSAMSAALATRGVLAVLSTLEHWQTLSDAIELTQHRIRAGQHEQHHTAVLRRWESAEGRPDAAPEVAAIRRALHERDIDAYRAAAHDLTRARVTVASHRTLWTLQNRLRAEHPGLDDQLRATAGDTAWDRRLSEIEQAWSWAVAERFVRRQYRPGLDTQREADLAAAKTALRTATGEFATALAWQHCLRTMTPGARRALASFEYFARKKGGAHTAEYRRAARSAIAQAKTAVPAWVLPIGRVAELFSAAPNSFDVVIVDEASQAGLTSLFLLWLAPRVIVVGDDKQCTPTSSPRNLVDALARLRADFPAVPDHVRKFLLPNGNLYSILGSAFPSVIRLREHFRCMPEIISWPSREFYDNELVPLRQHGVDRLAPVRIGQVPGGGVEGANDGLTNRIEAEHIVDTLAACLEDPAYDGKTFGIIALQSRAQVDLIEKLVLRRIPDEEIDRRDIAVGLAPNFQGDERHVMFVSTVVAGRVRQMRQSTSYKQRLNVAVSRARDQLWVITSLAPEDLGSDDLRHRMLSHYRDGEERRRPALPVDQIPTTVLREPFTSLFAQQVYRAIRARGYDADARVTVGNRRLDIVVRGSESSVAVVCDEFTGLSARHQHAQDRALRELRRAHWPFCRVAHSQFVLDPEDALTPVWQTLAEHGIQPADTTAETEPKGA
ncbi:AAA domain-containing protein [Amycolatopsis sp.]|uniref:AAA domain-containing protein n=1 Tax=Amycolatopsis sp. TaxID=37632 RepID=UPI002DFA54D9|nr:AAA domain-containing protein [Amycolatopsis sp.]